MIFKKYEVNFLKQFFQKLKFSALKLVYFSLGHMRGETDDWIPCYVSRCLSDPGSIIELTGKKEKVLIEDGTEKIEILSYFVLNKKVCVCPGKTRKSLVSSYRGVL